MAVKLFEITAAVRDSGSPPGVIALICMELLVDEICVSIAGGFVKLRAKANSLRDLSLPSAQRAIIAKYLAINIAATRWKLFATPAN